MAWNMEHEFCALEERTPKANEPVLDIIVCKR